MTIKFWAVRVTRMVLVLVTVTLLVNAITFVIPGDTALNILGPESTEQQREVLREELGLNMSFFERYFSWVSAVFSGDWGTSFASGRPVLSEIGTRLGVTLQVVLGAEVLALLIAVPVGLFSADRPNKLLDRLASFAAFLFLSIPSFVIGLVLIWLLAVQFQLLPASGYVPFLDNRWGNVQSLTLPVITLALAETAVYVRVLRGSAVETTQQPFVFAAETRGVNRLRLMLGTVLRPSVLPLINLVGIHLGLAFGGALVIETLFGLPGVGRLAISAIGNRDIPLIQGVVLLSALAVVFMNFLVDVVQAVIDPRGKND